MRYLTTKEVAKIFGVGFRSVQRWIREGKLKATRMGKRGYFRIKEEDLKNL